MRACIDSGMGGGALLSANAIIDSICQVIPTYSVFLGLGCGAEGLGLRVKGLGFGVWGLDLHVIEGDARLREPRLGELEELKGLEVVRKTKPGLGFRI